MVNHPALKSGGRPVIVQPAQPVAHSGGFRCYHGRRGEANLQFMSAGGQRQHYGSGIARPCGLRDNIAIRLHFLHHDYWRN